MPLRLKKIGNRIVEVVGGRAIHPVNVRTGGFYRLPATEELHELEADLAWALEAAMDTVEWVSAFDVPDFDRDWDLIAVREAGDYPMMGNHIASSSGRMDIPVQTFDAQVSEHQVPHSTALHSSWTGGEYLVGPLARFAVNRDGLTGRAATAADAAGLGAECRNPFRSIVVRAVEVLAACDDAARIVASYTAPGTPAVDVPPRAGVGRGASEAPRGLLFHRYELAADGTIVSAAIVPPTAQNQAAIEHDLRSLIEQNLDLDDERLTKRCEQLIRSYDPCISCATHFLDLQMDRR